MNESWIQTVNQKPKLRTYKLFKELLCTENYVENYMSKRKRSLLAQLRLGILPLHIETGRYTNKPLEERICTLCNSDEIEDEFHFLLKCDLYLEPRKNLLSTVNSLYPHFSNLTENEQLYF